MLLASCVVDGHRSLFDFMVNAIAFASRICLTSHPRVRLLDDVTLVTGTTGSSTL